MTKEVGFLLFYYKLQMCYAITKLAHTYFIVLHSLKAGIYSIIKFNIDILLYYQVEHEYFMCSTKLRLLLVSLKNQTAKDYNFQTINVQLATSIYELYL